ncbi:MAG TPA: UbiD family decarboxylase [Acidothermaceae bacterium]|jgi:2,5-furandicarboxylate decarboxylase 1|nr:UbiD family decarboxylase [Acidothermaceae bacterium]
MAKSLRTFLDELSKHRPDDLKEVTRPVDAEHEIAALLSKLQRRQEFPAVLFRNVGGSDYPVLINLHASYERMAIAMGVADLIEMQRVHAEREANLRPLRWLDRDGDIPVREVVLRGDEADLTKLPLTHKCEKDAGKYISAGVSIMKERDTGQVNTGMYRLQLQGPRQLGFMVNPANHGSHIHRDYEDHGEPTPIAVVIGHHPCFYLSSVAKVPGPGHEMELCGSLMGEDLEVVRGETVDLPVPAHAEIVIEGYMHPGKRQYEGTFGEWPGYYNMEGPRPFIEVTAITMRRDAICQDLFNAHPEHTILGAIPRMGSLYRAIRHVCPNLVGVNLPWSGGGRSFCYISLKKRAEGEPTQAAFAALTTEPNVKHVVIVDDDIDVFNEQEVLWAMAMRFQADTDMKVIPNALGAHLNPSAYGYNRLERGAMETKVIFDCTKPLPPVEFAERALAKQDLVDAIEPREYVRPLAWSSDAARSALKK